VLLVHGFPDTAYTWDHAMAAVAAAGFRAVAPFQRGYWPSAIPADDPTSETLGQDVVALIDALGEKSAVVVGHDWGASAAYTAAITHPDKVRLLVTLAIPHPAAVKITPRLAWKVRHFITLKRKNAARNLAADNFAQVDELVSRWSPAWTNRPASETEHVKESFRHPGSLDAAVGYYRALSLRIKGPLTRRVTVPTVAFAGETDVVPPRAYEKARHMFTASYEVVQMHGGHFMHREDPEQFSNELVRVLRDKA
jgi:pimeloyl-ACP methyl ester carboxylesterase